MSYDAEEPWVEQPYCEKHEFETVPCDKCKIVELEEEVENSHHDLDQYMEITREQANTIGHILEECAGWCTGVQGSNEAMIGIAKILAGDGYHVAGNQ